MFANFFAIVQLLASLLPVINQLIAGVEAALPMPGQGPAKLQMVKALLESAYQHTTNATIAFTTLWPMAQTMIAGLVAVQNAAGVFKSATPGTANAAASSGAVAVPAAVKTN